MVVLAQFPVWLTGILIAVFLFVCVLMILVVLIQRPAGGGLSGAFGSGAGSGQTAFGAKTGDALTFATITIFVVYLLFAVGLNFAARPPGAPLEAAPGPGAAVPPTAPIGGPPEEQPTGFFTPPQPEPGLPLEPEPPPQQTQEETPATEPGLPPPGPGNP
jgi:preprotein translocase subunit SecG